MKNLMKPKQKDNTFALNKNIIPLSFVKGTPVLPALSKKNVREIIDLLDELDDESVFEDEDSTESEH